MSQSGRNDTEMHHDSSDLCSGNVTSLKKIQPGEDLKPGVFAAADVSVSMFLSLGWADETGPLATGFVSMECLVMSPCEVRCTWVQF